MSFFPSEAEQIQSIAEAESVTPSAFSMFISQDDIDHILRAGGNADAARMKIAAEVSKQKPLEDCAAFLKALYYGGNGLITDNGRLSAWYGDDGIHIATGDTSRYLRSAQVIGWADAAERIEELLDGGAFATNLEVTEAPRYERLGIAVDVWNLYHDFSDEAKSLGHLSCLGNIHSTSFPEETERLTDDLLNPAFRDRLLSEYKVFMDAYRENRALLRFHYHKSQALLTRLEDLSLPRKEFRSDMEAIPETGRFITEDEIAASLANGSSFEGGKTRIYAFFQTSHTPKENADFLKKEYGIGGHKEVLHHISFAMKKNSMTALVGPSGSGKSTIANLLARLWDVKSGNVTIRGVDIRNVPLSELMDQISMVFQRVYLFQDTIYNNIIMGKPDATEEEVYEAARKARCYDFIMALPDGFQTVVGEGGATLSGGEKQRISIARCILKDAPIVILDEATASVDTDNESYIQEAISELVKGKTLLVIAHRLNTICQADQILVIADGRISEQGTHDELIAKAGIYQDFVNIRKKSSSWSLA